ncbi:Pentatricopeptide repeat-containing protein [Melia azedarach]|uniref:Pentatricopeptide repeat-containing protein n=1 Tax=Melia azedarach TaxID=155640 RepID=A0ACC1WV58_MELAZ|nr:Pentatricopeptide repeat-containing protein [Melia azedarach]
MVSLGVEPNLVSWNGMIAGFNHSGHYQEAVWMFHRMHGEGFKPDHSSVSSVLSAVGDLENLSVGVQIHGYVIKQGLGQDNCVISSLIDMYGKCARTWQMSKVFDEMVDIDVGACNALITGFSRNGLIDKALEMFRQFQTQGMELNIVSWTSIIAGCSQNGRAINALELFREMQTVGLKPNKVTIPCLLPACGSIAALKHGKAVHCFSIRSGISNDVNVSSALIDMYAKCGRIQVSRLCFDRTPSKNLVCWNAMMGGYAMHGKAKEAIEMFQWMQRSEQKPDFISFACVLSACSQAGLTDEGCNHFNSMSKEYGIEARIEHYTCMVTLLGHAGRLEEAYNMIEQMPFEPDACIWGALLSSCRVHKNVILGEVAANNLFELEPTNPGTYILLSNIYASSGMRSEVDAVRDMMEVRGLRKSPGCSWIEVKNKVHMLLAGDESHPQMVQIMEKLNKLSMEMKQSGYLPNTDFVLQDVEEQDKEHFLCGHSEKLAVVVGLINTPEGSPLQVIKNLRICSDCHAVIKFISSLERRDIYVRDTNRFHHFKDGVCSCGDYW